MTRSQRNAKYWADRMDIWQGRIATGASIQGPRGEAYRKLAAEGFAHSKEMYFLWLQRDAKPKRKRG